MSAVETINLSKTYYTAFNKKIVDALVELNLSVEEGIIFGLLGPNGAGKTTLIKILLGIAFPTSGQASILNKDISDYSVRNQIGFLPENHKLPSYFTGKEILNYYGKLNGLDGKELSIKGDELIDLVGLEKWKKIKIGRYSKGMLQRLGLAQALINDPKLLFLDEPTDGVDPVGRSEIRNILLELKRNHKTIFLNSHILSEVELITDRVAILNKGALIKEGSIEELTEKKEVYKINFVDDYLPEDIVEKFRLIKENKYYLLKVENMNDLNEALDYFRNQNIMIKEIVPQKNTLEEMFISLIKNETGNEGTL
jgi:ABC-2 type transport system ATP-binding protein